MSAMEYNKSTRPHVPANGRLMGASVRRIVHMHHTSQCWSAKHPNSTHCDCGAEAADEYETTLSKCAVGEHPKNCVSSEWSYEGSPDVPNGTIDFKVYHCSFCGEEWT
jgi:hypothetical protein